MSVARTRILATRKSKTRSDSVEALCLEVGVHRRHRLVTRLDGTPIEFLHEVKPVEFDSAHDACVDLFLMESMWRLRLTPNEISRACVLFDLQTTASCARPTVLDVEQSLGSLSLLLLECVSRLETLKSDSLYTLETLDTLDHSLSLLEVLAERHPHFDTHHVESLRAQYQSIWDEVTRRRTEIGH